MAYTAPLEVKGNGSIEFFAKLQSLLPKPIAHVVIVPTRMQGSFLLVRPWGSGGQ